MNASSLHYLTISLALGGAVLALIAVLIRAKAWAPPKVVNGVFSGAYLLMGLSVLLFILRGWR